MVIILENTFIFAGKYLFNIGNFLQNFRMSDNLEKGLKAVKLVFSKKRLVLQVVLYLQKLGAGNLRENRVNGQRERFQGHRDQVTNLLMAMQC